MTEEKTDLSPERTDELCKRWYIRKLSLFGSVLRDDFGLDSDVDVLVEFEPGETPGFALIRLEEELSALLGGRQVDLVIENALNRRVKKYVLAQAEVRYVSEG
jgi:uncharacterized protein